MALALLRAVEFVLGGKQVTGYAQGLAVMCTTLQAELSAIIAMHLGKQAPGSEDQPCRPRLRGVTRWLRTRPTIVTLASYDPGRIKLRSSIYDDDVLLPVILLALPLHGCEGGRSSLSFQNVTRAWSRRASFTLVEASLILYGLDYLNNYS